jgi:cysteinyl-tRNA synthetase
MLRIYNTRTRKVEEIVPLKAGEVSLYTCGPTVYDHAHIGNLSSYVFADTLRRAITANNLTANHAMNYTDVDDKTIRRSREHHPNDEPRKALAKLTDHFIAIFRTDMQAVGNEITAVKFLRATETIEDMKQLITELHAKGFAYTADDGVYFSIEAYRKSGKIYGQLLELTASNTSEARIQNDEYDKESVHDFALWKKKKDGEPAWEFTLENEDISGRPGWHIECSVMSREALGQPFDIHTGGIDLVFPHHENEIAQSTALEDSPVMATFFAHNNHILVNSKKMAKSAQNFYTLEDVKAKGFDPLAFRMLVLQGHYRNQVNFTWESLEAAGNRLHHWREIATLRWQIRDTLDEDELATNEDIVTLLNAHQAILDALNEDLNTPVVLQIIDEVFSELEQHPPLDTQQTAFETLLAFIDNTLGLKLQEYTPDISDEAKQILAERTEARMQKDWQRSDELRTKLSELGIAIRDTAQGVIWSYNNQQTP